MRRRHVELAAAVSLAVWSGLAEADALCTTPWQRANPDYTFSIDLATPAVIEQESLLVVLVQVSDGRVSLGSAQQAVSRVTLQVSKGGIDLQTIELAPEARYENYCFGIVSIYPLRRSLERIALEEYRLIIDISKLPL